MKGLILAGGEGTRLRPITHTSAKQLVPVANKPILFYGIEAMAEAGIREIGIITGPTAEEVMNVVGDGSAFGVSITYIHQPVPLGLAHCVLIAEDFLAGDDFVMYLGDNMLEQSLSGFIAQFQQDSLDAAQLTLDGTHQVGSSATASAARILLCPVPDPSRFGVATIDAAGHVVELVEKPEHPESDLALVGVYLFTSVIHEAVRSIDASDRGELEITDAIQWLIDNDYVVSHEVLQGWWLDTGKKDPLLESNRRVLESLQARNDGEVDEASLIDGTVIIESGAKVTNSHIRGPVVIGKSVRIENSYIGPYTSVADECIIIDSEIDNSVVLDGARIEGVPRLVDSLIGRKSVVERSGLRPKATRLMIGDDCTVDLI
ncbi:MAG: NTP transferase domain-containing protein [Microthrixaceae bacterium]|nr:NTP transferase domain-containing protein [Microthrixaceae bacterium]